MIYGKEKTKHYRKWVADLKPYRHFITLTFQFDYSPEQICKYTSIFLHEYNRMIFGKNYKNKDHVEGFGFIEKHPLKNSRCENHVHLLTKDNGTYNDRTFKQLKEIFKKAAKKVVYGKRKKQVFNLDCLKIKKVNDQEERITYCFKQIDDQNLNRFKPITTDGLSDFLGFY